jgi:lipase maturation factor 1
MNMDTGNNYRLVSALFLRLLGVIYLIAFFSIATQILGLAGSQGILPFAQKLASVNAPGVSDYLRLPTLFWLNSSDAALSGAAWSGCAAAVLIILGRRQRAALVVAYVLYLSIYHACQPFMNFQWDGLLLESGFLAIFLTPRSRVLVLLFRWLLFRLRFMSGLSKLTSGDPTWSGLTALNYYFQVQPLPTPLAWYANQLPEWLLKTGTAGTLFVELVVPFMMFLPRRWRFAAAWLTILWQVLIILTSNHNWINFLTIALCLFLFDDQALEKKTPSWLKAKLATERIPSGSAPAAIRVATGALAATILLASAGHFWELIKMQPVTGPMGKVLDYAEAYRVVSSYHVFPTMKTQRIELELVGSIDGKDWRRYEFKYKPGDLTRRPPVVIPFQPRLDWQMWFVTLGPVHLPWFYEFLQGLLRNSPPVTALLKNNPFPDQAPRYIRVYAYRYEFTDTEERARTGQWWKRQSLGSFSPLPWVER